MLLRVQFFFPPPLPLYFIYIMLLRVQFFSSPHPFPFISFTLCYLEYSFFLPPTPSPLFHLHYVSSVMLVLFTVLSHRAGAFKSLLLLLSPTVQWYFITKGTRCSLVILTGVCVCVLGGGGGEGRESGRV